MWQDYSLRYGAAAGGVSIVYLYMLYLNNPSLLVQGYALVIWLFYMGAMLLVGITERDSSENAGFVSMQPLLQAMFKTFSIAYVMQYAFMYLLFIHLDPSLQELVREVGIKAFIDQRDPAMTEEIFQQQLQGVRNQSFVFFDILGLGIHLAFGFILSVALAFVIKRERPDY